jgi:hypothetical protein
MDGLAVTHFAVGDVDAERIEHFFLSTITLFHLVVAKMPFARIFCAGLQNIKVIKKGFDFFTDFGKLSPLLLHSPTDLALEDLSHRSVFDLQFCE